MYPKNRIGCGHFIISSPLICFFKISVSAHVNLGCSVENIFPHSKCFIMGDSIFGTIPTRIRINNVRQEKHPAFLLIFNDNGNRNMVLNDSGDQTIQNFKKIPPGQALCKIGELQREKVSSW